MNILQIPASPANYTAGRGGSKVTMVVLHTTVGSMAATLATFQNPSRAASAHYVIGLDGRVVQMVAERNTAWHAGNFPVNESSIGIEHVDDGDFNGPRTPELYAASSALVADICKRYDIPLSRAHIRKHSEVSDLPTGCPDALDVDRIVGGLFGDVGGTITGANDMTELVTGDNNDGKVYRTDWMTKRYVTDPGALPGFVAALGPIKTVPAGALGEVQDQLDAATALAVGTGGLTALQAQVLADINDTLIRIEQGLRKV